MLLAVGVQFGQLVKQYVGHRVVVVAWRVMYGTAEGIRAVVQAIGTGTDINTAFIKRLNETFRSRWAGLAHKSRRLAQTVALVEAGIWLVGTVYTFCTVHASLAQTSTQVADLVAARWTVGDLLSYRAPLPAWVPPPRRGRSPKYGSAMPKRPRCRLRR